MKLGFIYAGQGAQYVGMGKALYDQYPLVKATFEEADEALGFSITELMFKGPEESLMETENTQPAVLTLDVAISRLLKQAGVKPDLMAGLSLGEYAALVESQAMDFKTAVMLVKKRGKFMQEEVPLGKGGMAAILGAERSVVESITKEASEIGVCQGANFNCPGQIVISGTLEAVNKALEIGKEKGVRGKLLPVSAPFHCELLKGAGDKLGKELETVNVGTLEIPVISNVTADLYAEDEVKSLLIKQVSHSVLWEDCILKAVELGVTHFVEVGPGNALAGFIKRINKGYNLDIACISVEDVKSLEVAIKELRGE